MQNSIADVAAANEQAQAAGNLSIWTVYDRPKDFPDTHVARRFEVGITQPEPVATADMIQGTLSEIRQTFRACGLACLPRNDGDDPVIVECWL